MTGFAPVQSGVEFVRSHYRKARFSLRDTSRSVPRHQFNEADRWCRSVRRLSLRARRGTRTLYPPSRPVTRPWNEQRRGGRHGHQQVRPPGVQLHGSQRWSVWKVLQRALQGGRRHHRAALRLQAPGLPLVASAPSMDSIVDNRVRKLESYDNVLLTSGSAGRRPRGLHCTASPGPSLPP
jgi:hypothetical protein